MKFKKLATKGSLHVHKYILVVTHDTETAYDKAFYYCKTMKKVIETYKLKSQVGDTVEIFSAKHTFISKYAAVI